MGSGPQGAYKDTGETELRPEKPPRGSAETGEAKWKHQGALGFHAQSGPFPCCVSSQSPGFFPCQRRTVYSSPNVQGYGEGQHQKEIMG